jgi:uncharacterized protein YybS (DUF2232 family)
MCGSNSILNIKICITGLNWLGEALFPRGKPDPNGNGLLKEPSSNIILAVLLVEIVHKILVKFSPIPKNLYTSFAKSCCTVSKAFAMSRAKIIAGSFVASHIPIDSTILIMHSCMYRLDVKPFWLLDKIISFIFFNLLSTLLDIILKHS